MADKRKLQGEIDRCLKKVQEGVDAFEEIWKKMEATNNANQKEKFEADLKKEIKKLQRLRDQIKTWVVCPDIKDKQTLTDQRKLIETQMERFKVIEREAKIKAYSKEGLGTAGKVDPKEKEKEDITIWLSNNIRKLNVQIDKLESELESFTSKKKKLDREEQARVETCREWLTKHRYHINKLEAVLRMVDNSAVQFEEIRKIREDVEYYIDSNQDVDFEENEFIYDGLDLEEISSSLRPDMASSPTDSNDIDSLISNALQAASPPPQSSSAPGSHSKHKGDEDNKRRQKVNDDTGSSSAKSNLTLKIINTTSVSSSSSSKVPQTPTKLNAVSTSTTTNEALAARSLPSSSGLGYAQVASAHQPAKTSQATISPKVTVPSGVNGLVTLSSSVSAPFTQLSSHSTSSVTMTATVPTSVTSAPSVSSEQTTSTVSVSVLMPSSLTSSQSSTTIPSTSQSVLPTTQQLMLQQLEQLKLQDSVRQQQQQQQQIAEPADSKRLLSNGSVTQNEPLSSLSKTSNDVPDSRLLLENGSISAPLPSIDHTSHTDIHASFLQSLMRPLSTTDQQLPSAQLSIPTQLPSTTTIRLNPLYGVAPLGPQPLTKEHVVRLAMLEAAYRHLPHPTDSERLRMYFQCTPCPTPPYYPQTSPPLLSSPDFFNKLDTNSLFFIFYYMEGTKAQYLAAKALKKQSWRFHTKYMMWFQRHEEPKVITDEFEQGTYIYFDYEKWSQRKKEDFKFEYRFLEDQDLS